MTWAACADVAGGCGLYRRPVDRLDPTRLPGSDGAAAPFFSPDGRWIGFFADGKLKKIAASGSRFVSRGDKSGTHVMERGLWKEAGITPAAPWYIESGQGLGATLGIANDRRAYTITDRGTYLTFQKRVSLPILVEKDRPLLHIYSVMEVNPANGPRVNAAGGKAFADFMLVPEVAAVIRTFGVDKYGQALFVPIAGKKDEDF